MPIDDRSGLLLLDTHCWIWIESGPREQLSRDGLSAIEQARRRAGLLVSVISVWEVGLLEAKGRVLLKMPCEAWVKRALAAPGLELAPLTPEIAIESTRLPGEFHGDPADRILVATARLMGARLLTRDRQIIEHGRQQHARIVAA